MASFLTEKRSDAMRRGMRAQGKTGWQRLKHLFEVEPDATEGIGQVPLFAKFSTSARPWDSKPSEHYIEVMRVRNYWYHHPPKPWVMVSYLFLLLFVNLIIAFLPVSVNYNRFYALWRDLAKPAFVYEEPTALILAWALAHVVSSLGPWFVYLSGGWLAHKWDILPCFLMMACEALLPDLMFGARRLDYTFFCTLACCGLCVLSMYKSARTTYLATAAFFPLLGCYVYLALLSASMWDLNGYKYTLRVI